MAIFPGIIGVRTRSEGQAPGMGSVGVRLRLPHRGPALTCSQYNGDINSVDAPGNVGDVRSMDVPSIQLAFGKRVRALREAQGHSQEAFAALANIDRGAFGKLERGEINVGLISMSRIAVALGLNLSSLLEGVEIDPEEIKALPRSARGPKPIGARTQ